jgi:hypothetical protein
MGLDITVENEEEEEQGHMHLCLGNFYRFQEALDDLHPQMKDHDRPHIKEGCKLFQALSGQEEISHHQGQAIFAYLFACDEDEKIDPNQEPGVITFRGANEAPSAYCAKANYMEDMLTIFFKVAKDMRNTMYLSS